ncbi:hypothetical protein [Paenibacillus naphthalenovorans]|uniref:hypothetical protein n=1 Tax=Paenibacillus naphthalenovorans TaxID=162209 RepID=UPI0010F8006B|nr:hypothetical protein [Paenibacillus naphthalenovorans]
MGTISRYSQIARSIVFTLAVIIFLVYKIGDFHQLAPMISILSIIAILLSIPASSLTTKIFALLFLVTGTWLVMQKGIDPYNYLYIYGDMLYLLSLFAMLPFLAIPLKLGRYDQSIEEILFKKTRSVTSLHRTISSISFLLSSILNLATIPIMYYSIKGAVEKIGLKHTDKFMCLAILNGYAVSVAWSPFSGGVAIALETTKVPWSSVFYKLFIIGLLGLFLNWLIFWLIERRSGSRRPEIPSDEHHQTLSEMASAQESEKAVHQPFIQKTIAKIWQIVLVILLLISVNVGLTGLWSLGLVVTTSILAFPCAFLWALAIKQGTAFLGEARSYVINKMPGMADQFAIFLSTGFFVQALQYSGYNHYVIESMLQFNHAVGSSLFLLIVPLITLGFGFMGMHPITAITLLAEAMNPLALGISAEHLAIALVGGAVMTFSIGPFSGTLNMFSVIIRQGTFRIAAWNLLYTLGFFLFLALVLLVI